MDSRLHFGHFFYYSKCFKATDIPGYSRILKYIPGYSRTFKDILEYSRIIQNLPGYYRILQDIPEPSRILQDISGDISDSPVSAETVIYEAFVLISKKG